MSLLDDVLAGPATHTDNIKTQTHENGPIPHNLLITVVNHCHLVAIHLDSSKEAPIKLGKVLQSQKPPISTARFTLETYPRQDPGLATDTVTAVQLHAVLQHGDRIHGQMFDHPIVRSTSWHAVTGEGPVRGAVAVRYTLSTRTNPRSLHLTATSRELHRPLYTCAPPHPNGLATT